MHPTKQRNKDWFPSHLKTKQNKAKPHTWNNCFQDPGHQATKVSDPRETGYKWHDPSLLLQVTTLREFLCCHTEGTQRGLVDSLIWGDGAGIWEKPGRLLFGREYQRGESCIDRTLFICSGCHQVSCISSYMWGDYQRLEKD